SAASPSTRSASAAAAGTSRSSATAARGGRARTGDGRAVDGLGVRRHVAARHVAAGHHPGRRPGALTAPPPPRPARPHAGEGRDRVDTGCGARRRGLSWPRGHRPPTPGRRAPGGVVMAEGVFIVPALTRSLGLARRGPRRHPAAGPETWRSWSELEEERG